MYLLRTELGPWWPELGPQRPESGPRRPESWPQNHLNKYINQFVNKQGKGIADHILPLGDGLKLFWLFGYG